MSIQHEIESQMESLSEGKRWEYIVLFSPEGLPMASFGQTQDYSQDELLEFSFQLIQTILLLKDNKPVKKISLDTDQGKILVFYFLSINDQNFTLAAVVNKKTAYKRSINQLIQIIKSILI